MKISFMSLYVTVLATAEVAAKDRTSDLLIQKQAPQPLDRAVSQKRVKIDVRNQGRLYIIN